ncbi:MAG: helix-turn-helix domain-containing protein [Eubacterium sp.]|nr:helix-turn-helix domain-containing protein [Eubacterium sp.]
MFEYMTVQETAKKWELSERRIQKLCAENRIDGVVHLSRVWLIPKNAEKPADGRKKENRNVPL